MDLTTAVIATGLTATAAGAYYLSTASTTPAPLGPIPSRLRNLAQQEAKETGSKEPFVWSHQSRPEREGESPVVRSLLAKDGFLAPLPGVRTLYDNFRTGVGKFGSSNCLGHRPSAVAPFTWMTYDQVMEDATLVGSALCSFDCDPHVGICSINRPEWIITEQAINAYSKVLVPLYDTFGEEALVFIMNQSNMEVVFAHPDRVELVMKCAPSVPSLKTIVSFGEEISDALKAKTPEGIRLLSFPQIKQIGRENRTPHRPPEENQVATICYTSGTTGMPKGAVLTHRNIMADVLGIMNCGAIVISPSDVHISYLPLAHMFERIVITFVMQFGAATGFYRGDVRTLFDDIKMLRPTIFPSVPKIYSRIFDKVMLTVSQSSISRIIFNRAYEVKRQQLPYNQYKHALWDKIIFSKVQDMLGGRIRIMLTGSAPISYKTLEFLRIVFGCEVFEGYGQTECAAACSVSVPGVATMGCTSVPVPTAEMKLVDVPEMGFLTSHSPPQGEVWIRGPIVFQGYFSNPELSQEALTEDGWLRTGDVGQLLPDGTIQIIDRKKNIFKLAQGEYISPEKVENVMSQSRFVMMSFVYGDSFKSSTVAIVVPDPDVLKSWAVKNSVTGNVEDLCTNETLRKVILEDIATTCRTRKLNGYEIPRAIHLEHRPFTPESEIVTPTMKLKRPFAKRFYESIISDLYVELNE